MEQERLTFPEAVEFLANRANLKIPDNFVSPDYKALKAKIEKIQNINREAARFYHTCLHQPQYKHALAYLTKRGLSNATIRAFGIGYSPSFNGLSDYLTEKGYDLSTMQEAGLIRISKSERPYDIFSERIIFPIIDAQDKVIGFGGRIFNTDQDFAKYVNTSSNPVFNKSRSLYSINLLKKLKQSQRVNDIILVEGYMDTISLYQEGIKNVVAPMGTSLTKRQCDLLSRYTKMVYICFDGDSAGQRMTLRGLDLLAESGIEVKVVELTDNKDPDDAIREYGKEKFLELVHTAVPLIDFKLKVAEKGIDLSTLDGKKKYALSATNILSTLNPLTQEVYAKIVAKKTGIAEATIIAQASGTKTSISRPTAPPNVSTNKSPSVHQDLLIASRFVLSSAIELKEYVGIDDIAENLFVLPFHQKVQEYLQKCIADRRTPTLSDIFDLSKEQEEANAISTALDEVLPENRPIYYRECLQKLNEGYKANEIKRLVSALIAEKDESQKELIKQKIKDLNKTQPIK